MIKNAKTQVPVSSNIRKELDQVRDLVQNFNSNK